MRTTFVPRAAILLVGLSLLIAGCQTRGNLAKTCEPPLERIPVPAGAATAVYFDLMGNPLGGMPGSMQARGEDMTGTSKLEMCATPLQGPGTCPVGWCPMVILGTTYCFRCS
jgi:hypothetical protein